MRDSAGVVLVEHPVGTLDEPRALALASSASLRIGVQEGQVEQQFTSIRAGLRTAAGEFVLLDRGADELRVFDARGTFLRRIGGSGRGPGEFEDPVHLAQSADGSFAVWDWATEKVSWFRSGGEHVRTSTLPGRSLNALGALPEGRLLAVLDVSPRTGMPPADGRVRNAGSLVRIEPDGDSVTLANFPGTEWFMRVANGAMQIQRPWHTSRLLAAVSPTGAWLSDGTRWEITRRRTNDGAVDRIVRFADPLERFTASRVDEIHAAELAAAGSDEQRQSRARRQAETTYPEAIPPIEELLVDAEGRLWIGRLEAPPVELPTGMGRATRQWIVLTPDGEAVLGTVSLPARRRPLFADRDGVLLVAVDDLDVPYVEWWPFAVP